MQNYKFCLQCNEKIFFWIHHRNSVRFNGQDTLIEQSLTLIKQSTLNSYFNVTYIKALTNMIMFSKNLRNNSENNKKRIARKNNWKF